MLIGQRSLGAFGLAALIAGAAPAQAAELVTNGSFTSPTISGTYNNCGVGPYACGPSTAGDVYFTKNASSVNGSFYGATDHTGNGGYLIVVDPKSTSAFFTQTINVVSGANYTFSFWASQLNFGSSVDAFINGSLIGSLTPNAGWTQFSQVWNSGSASSVNLALHSGNGSYYYNDFAVDDVSFTGPAVAGAVPEPATWAMMLLGFGAVGYSMRRKQQVKVTYATA